jgi:hypothetical protein
MTNICAWEAGSRVGVAVALAVGCELAAVLGAVVDVLWSRDARFELGMVTVGSAGVKRLGMVMIVPRGADIGCRVGVDASGSDMARGLTVITESDVAIGTDVAIMVTLMGGSGINRVLVLVLLWTAGAEERVVMKVRTGVLVSGSARVLAFMGGTSTGRPP